MTSKRKNPEEELSAMDIMGRLLALLGLLIVIIAVVLLDGHLGAGVLLLLAGNVLFFVGYALSYLPREKK